MEDREKILRMGRESYRIVVEKHTFENYKQKIMEIEEILRRDGY